jgi:hypothetical protein
MIFRAAFWIAVVAVLMPHEPDLGFGRPGAESFTPTQLSGWIPADVKAPGLCEGRQSVCAGGLMIVDDLRNTILSNLDRVKSDLKQQARLDAGRKGVIDNDPLARLPRF